MNLGFYLLIFSNFIFNYCFFLCIFLFVYPFHLCYHALYVFLCLLEIFNGMQSILIIKKKIFQTWFLP